MRAVDIVRKVAPRARSEYIESFENGDGLLAEHEITTPLRFAHFLAQVLHETEGLTIQWESGNYSADRLVEVFGVGHHSAAITASEAGRIAHNGPAIFERVYGLGNPGKARELGNTKPGDGFRFRGGGMMQTTGRGNYRRMGQKCDVDFELHPDLIVSAEHALKPALAEWSEGQLNALADQNDIHSITKRINGGLNGLSSREAWLAKVRPLCRTVVVPSVPSPPPPYIERNAPLESDTETPNDPASPPKTGITEVAQGVGGVGLVGMLSTIWEKIVAAPDSILQAMVAAISHPSFWIFAAVIGGGAFIWWKRRQQKAAQ